jgi:hypothetical protein
MLKDIFMKTDFEQRMAAVKEAIAHHTIEGLSVPKETIADLYLWASGDLSMDEVSTRIDARFMTRPKT